MLFRKLLLLVSLSIINRDRQKRKQHNSGIYCRLHYLPLRPMFGGRSICFFIILTARLWGVRIRSDRCSDVKIRVQIAQPIRGMNSLELIIQI